MLAWGSLGGKQIHARFMLSQFHNDDVVKSSLVYMYSKFGLLDSSRLVFDSIALKNSLSWTSMISGYARVGRKVEAVKLLKSMSLKNLISWTALVSGLVQSGNWIDGLYMFIEMRSEGIDILDPFVVSTIVGACANLASLGVGKQIHGFVIVLGYESSLFVSNALVDMYAKCSDVLAAKEIFFTMQKRDVVSWTSVIVGAAHHGLAKEALRLYDEMISASLKPNEVTFIGLIYACSHAGLVSKGRYIFNSMIKDYKICPSLHHYTCFLDLLSRSGHLREAENLIQTMPFEPDEAAWAALLTACKAHKNTQMAIRIADHILNLKPKDTSTYILLSNTYAGASMWENVSKVRKLMGTMEFRKEPGNSCIELGKESHVFYAGETSHLMKSEIFGLLLELDIEIKRRGYVPDTSCVLHDLEQSEKEKQLFWHSERMALAYGLLKSVPGTAIRIVKNLRVCGDCHNVFKYICNIVRRDCCSRCQ